MSTCNGSTSCTTSATATTAPISDLTIIPTPPDTALSAAIAAAAVPLTLATPLETVAVVPAGLEFAFAPTLPSTITMLVHAPVVQL